MDAGKRTTAHFGRKWIRNFFKNLKLLNKTLVYRQSSLPVIVTGSGPGLEQALPIIAKIQEYCIIIAASSSVQALSLHGIKPDLTITTDGGNWALKHLHSYTRTPDLYVPVAVNLSASLLSQLKSYAFLIINDNSFWQNIVLHELGLPSVIIPQRGTVTATALDLALLLSNANIYLAGMDFSNNDIRTHVKPYAFDNLFYGQANRLIPFYSVCFNRSFLLNEGGSMDIYSAWFKDKNISLAKRVYSLTDHKIFDTMIPQFDKSKKNTEEIFNIVKTNGNPDQFCQRGVNALLSALKDKKYSEQLKQELKALLPSDQSISKDIKNEIHDLETTIMEIALKGIL